MQMLHQFFKILTGVDLVKFAGLHQREQNSGCLSSSLRVGPVPGLAPDDRISQKAFLLVVIDGQLCVPEKTGETLVVFQKIFDGFGE